ncbi:c-type cytochrome [Duganella sp. FT50W]|uniref:C-type cytochrome n=1 Tax=Duganella lactea TaxID=2692173 RepID=A0A6L8MFP4_9BURK|nr:c-type cytochrome [Duganella lactea]MYM34089.1 c-type cytochrome [Duganella lactea]MYM81324.1 c-type cytochrome [Duganella lactea]
MKKLLALAAMLAATTSVSAAPDAAKTEKTYTTTCAACHGAGIMGAPKVGDKAAWKPRIARGKPALYASAISGVRMMPPRGGNPGLKDDELKAIVDYMIAKSN